MRTPFAGLEQILKCVIENTTHVKNPDLSDEERYEKVIDALFGTKGNPVGSPAQLPDKIFFMIGKRVNEGEKPTTVIKEMVADMMGPDFVYDDDSHYNEVIIYDRFVETMRKRFSRNKPRFTDHAEIIKNLHKTKAGEKPSEDMLKISEILSDTAENDIKTTLSCLRKSGWPL